MENMDKKNCDMCGHNCAGGNGSCGVMHGGCGHHGGKHLLKMLLKLIILALIFMFGFQLGQMTGYIRANGRGMMRGYDTNGYYGQVVPPNTVAP
jgi:hypothetical protein